MRLKSTDSAVGKFTFRFEPAEREWFRHILDLYPAQEGPISAISKDAGANELLEKALAEAQKKLREGAELFLKAGTLDIDPTFKEFWDLTLSGDEIEELLQILNNVRVGLWIKLGKPDPNMDVGFIGPPSEEMVRSHMIMHVCAAWQNALMSAVDPEEDSGVTP